MKRLLCILIVLLSICGCAPKSMVKLPDHGRTDLHYVIDASHPDNYPAFMVGEGNIYSCRYGIHFYAADEFVPPKTRMFAELLATARPQLVEHKVELDRFDVYHNLRLRLLSFAGTGLGGAVGHEIARNADEKNNPAVDLPPFVLVENPGNGRPDNHENQIGCDGAAEGEYYPSQVNGGSDVIVVWLNFKVDAKPYSYRSMYQFHFDSQGGEGIAVITAIRTTIDAVASRILLQPAG